jgi:hypothetical protein
MAPARNIELKPVAMLAVSGTPDASVVAAIEAETIEFEQTMAAIEAGFEYKPTAFSCGEVVSTDAQNQGSAKIFSFAKLSGFSEAQTLQLFGKYYREDVLKNPDGTDHGNIRNFIAGGWSAVSFPDGLALKPKAPGVTVDM